MNPQLMLLRPFLLLAVVVTTSVADPTMPEPSGGVESVWIEGEGAARTNFPPLDENPFRARDLWEADALSGGQWIGKKWTAPESEALFLEYDFTVPAAGRYALYVRKFAGYGNFRWRLDGGDWHGVPASLHRSLDSTPFREDDELIYLDWFAMGGVELKPGRHTLRVEPIFPDLSRREKQFEPLGYDLFVLTKGPFFPGGKTRPGEVPATRTATAFAPAFPVDPFAKSPMDWRCLNEPRTGVQGGITVREGQFVFRDTGKPVRLLGVNMTFESFSDPEGTGYVLRRLAKLGFNLVRLEMQSLFEVRRREGKPRLIPIEEKLARFREILEALEEEGMFLALNWNFVTTDGVIANVLDESLKPQSVDVRPNPSAMPWLLFDPSVADVFQEGWKAVLSIPLRDGRPLARSPLLAFVTILQQESIFSDEVPGVSIWPSAVRGQAGRRLSQWLEKQGVAPKDLPSRWGLPEDEVFAEGGLPAVVPVAEIGGKRRADTVRFLAEEQAEYVASLTVFLRKDLGYAGILSPGNKSLAEPALLGWPHDWSLRNRDVMERLGNHRTFFEPSRSPWLVSPGSRYKDRSAIALEPLPGREDFVWFDQPLRHLSRAGMPSFLSEIGWPMPNQYRIELPLLSTALASLQGVDAIAFSSIVRPNWQGSNTLLRNAIFTPGLLGQMAAFGFAFRQGLLPTGPVVARVALSEETIFSLCPAQLSENADTQLTASLLGPKVPPNESMLSPGLWATGRVEVSLGAEKDSVERTNPAQTETGPIVAAEGSVVWDYDSRLFLIRAPAIQAVGGFLGGAGRIDLGDIAVESPMAFGVVCAVALDGRPLADSRKILLQCFSEEENTGAYAEGQSVKIIRSTGRPPILAKILRGTVDLLRPDAGDFVTTALDANGYPQISTSIGGHIPLLPSTFYYLIEK